MLSYCGRENLDRNMVAVTAKDAGLHFLLVCVCVCVPAHVRACVYVWVKFNARAK